jgi:hypothetical protein
MQRRGNIAQAGGIPTTSLWQAPCLAAAMPGIDFSAHVTNPIAQGPATAAAKAQDDSSSFGFDDLLDIVNPLQHIPVISTIYRHLTGDKIGVPEQIAGDTLYGGVTGLICSLGDALFQELTGKNVGDTVYAMVIGDDAPTTAVASTTSPAATASALPASVTPASVMPAGSLNIGLPDFSFLNASAPDEPGEAPDPVVAQRAVAAYRAAGRIIEAY